jgi:hypothetical protein
VVLVTVVYSCSVVERDAVIGLTVHNSPPIYISQDTPVYRVRCVRRTAKRIRRSGERRIGRRANTGRRGGTSKRRHGSEEEGDTRGRAC